MNPSQLKRGMQCMLADGSVIEIQEVWPGSLKVQVKFIDSLDNPAIPVGSIHEISVEEILGEFMGTDVQGLT